MMTFGMIVSDSHLVRFCSDVLSDCGGPNLRVWSTSPQGEFLAADILFYETGNEPFRRDALLATGAQTWLVAVNPDRVNELRQSVPEQDIQFVSQPISLPMLRVRLEHVVATTRSQLPSGQENTPEARSKCDQLLQLLLESQQRLHETAHNRNNLLARAGYDLAAPVSALNGYCGLLKSHLLDGITPTQSHILTQMQRNVLRIAKLAEVLSDLGTPTPLSDLPVDEVPALHGCVQRAVQDVLPHFEDKQISLGLDLRDMSATLHLEPQQMHYVLATLLENSCRSSTRNRSLEFTGAPVVWEGRPAVEGQRSTASSTSLEANAYSLELREVGAGTRADGYQTSGPERGASGSGGPADRGLGYLVCKMIIEQHGGQLYEQSPPAGSEFSVVLPIKRHVCGRIQRASGIS